MKLFISTEKSAQRIDKFLKKEVFFNSAITRGEIIRQIKTGNILLNGARTKASHVLKENDELEINMTEKNEDLVPNNKVVFEVVFENENFLVINKPAGLQIHPSVKNENDTLVNGLLYKFPKIKAVGDDPKNRPGIVHRLDKDTSGLLLVAKNQKTFLELKNKFKNREIQKTYWAVVYGKLDKKTGLVEKPLAKSKSYKKQVVAGQKTQTKVRPALTKYQVLEEMKGASLVEASPQTGRMHQIRVHFFALNHPIIGDRLYKKKVFPPIESVRRQLLHAKKIEFELDSKKFSFESELPQDFQDFLKSADTGLTIC